MDSKEILCHQIYDVLPVSPALKLLDDGKLYALITAYDEAIWRECASAARNAIFDFGIGDKASNYYSPMIRKELAVQLVERAILGSESPQDDRLKPPNYDDENPCASCRADDPADCEECETTDAEHVDSMWKPKPAQEQEPESPQDDGKPECEYESFMLDDGSRVQRMTRDMRWYRIKNNRIIDHGQYSADIVGRAEVKRRKEEAKK